MKNFLFLLIFLASSESSFACMNEYRTLLTGEVVYIDPSSGKIWNEEIDVAKLKLKSKELLAAYKRSDSLEYYSDYAAALTYLGNYKEAKRIYLEIEKRRPYRYTTASNLGTIYELTGKADSALFWIKKSIELNPNSHGRSEWIHVKILEYKLSKKQNIHRSILGLDFGSSELPSNSNSYNLFELENHIRYQLHERTKFVKPKNEIVGNIYFDLGNILAQTRDVQAALESYEAAKEYGFESELMNQRIEAFEALARKANRHRVFYTFLKDNSAVLIWVVPVVFFLTVFFVARFIIRRLKKRKKRLADKMNA